MDDHTKEECDLIKAKVSEATRKTRESDPENWMYKVHGSPKIGLRIEKFKKKKEA